MYLFFLVMFLNSFSGHPLLPNIDSSIDRAQTEWTWVFCLFYFNHLLLFVLVSLKKHLNALYWLLYKQLVSDFQTLFGISCKGEVELRTCGVMAVVFLKPHYHSNTVLCAEMHVAKCSWDLKVNMKNSSY